MDIQDEFWCDETALIDMLFNSNMSIRDIAKHFEVSQAEINKRIKRLGLDWVKNKTRKMSRGHAAITAQLKKLLPGVEVINEHHIGERLMLDIYCPKYNLAIEFHGRQHFVYNNHFYNSYSDFEAAQERDNRKVELCKQQGITLVVFRYNDSLTEDAVYNRILAHLRDSVEEPKVPQVKAKSALSVKGNPIYEESKIRRREYEKEMRQKIKNERRMKDSLKGTYE